MKRLLLFTTLSFAAGFYLAAGLNIVKSRIAYLPEQGYYQRPYNLEIVHTKSVSGRIKTYLVDNETGDYHKIGPNMYVGNPVHRLDSLLAVPDEYLKTLPALLE